jgi:hypothetical protein
VVTQLQIGKIFDLAYAQAASLKIALCAFTRTGICPTNLRIFEDAVFFVSEATERHVSSLPQPDTSLDRQTTAEPTGSLSEVSVTDGLFKNGLEKHKEYPLE